MGSVAPQLPNQGPDLMQNLQIQDGELCSSLLHTLIRFSFSGHRGREVPKACLGVAAPSSESCRPHLQFRKSHLTYRLLEAVKVTGNCYKMQLFENLYHFFILHKHRLLKSPAGYSSS